MDAIAGKMMTEDFPLLGILLMVGLPFILRVAGRVSMRTRPFAKRTLILGTSPLAQELLAEINGRAYAIVGVVAECGATDVRSFPGQILGTLEDLQRIVIDQRPERIIVALAERRGRLPIHQLVEARVRRRILIEDGENVYERLTGKLAIDSLTPSSVIFSKDFRPSGFALAIARGISVIAAVIGLIGLAPLFGLIALAIKWDSRGPILFIQDRVGRGDRHFKLLKFRTMHPAGETRSEWARDNDDRITRVGRWLRKFRLDELPQFINILRGDMNLVGPRPHPASNFELFTLVSRNTPRCGGQIPYYSLRSMIRPGITGWAQVRYRYANGLDEEIEKMRYDLYYIKHFSIAFDIRILLETIKIVLLGRESASTTDAAPASHERPGRISAPKEEVPAVPVRIARTASLPRRVSS